MRKIRKVLVACLLVASVFVTSVIAAPSVQELEDKKDKAEQEMKSLQDELADIMTSLNETEMKLVSTGEKIRQATTDLEEAETNEKTQYENMVKRIVAMYENGNKGTLALILESGSIAEMLQRVENVQALHDYDRKELEEYVNTKNTIAELKVTLEEEQAELEKLQENLAYQEAKLNKKIEEKKDEVADFEAQLAEAARKAAEEAERKRREEEARRREEEAKRREEEEKKNQIVVNNGGTNSNGGVNYTGTGDQNVGQKIVAAARTYIGVWYLWGGNDYNGIDCSGLTKACHASVGIYIDRWSGHQAIGGKKINSLEEALPGDIICYPGHVAIYIGNYRVIHAPRTGKQVQEATVYLKEITAIRRYW